MRFLIDECLTPALVSVANDAGFEAYHVVHRGWQGSTDRQLLERLLADELILVTNNREDFLALIEGVELHPGLVVILDNVRRSEQVRLFSEALAVIAPLESLINKVIDVSGAGDVRVYEMPKL